MSEETESDPFAGWADVYDVVYAPYERDVSFYRDHARRADGRVLEVGSGTGRITLDLLADGVDVVGVDASGAMLRQLREKAAERGLSPTVLQADMRRLPFDGEFAFAFLPFNTFLHNHTADEQLATLRGVRDLLADDGWVAFDATIMHPQVMLETTEDGGEIEHDGTTYELAQRYDVPSLPRQVMDVTRELRRDGELLAETSYQYAIAWPREVEHLLARAGFSEWSVSGGFDGESFGPDSSWMVWEART